MLKKILIGLFLLLPATVFAVCNPFTANTKLTASALNNAISSPCITSGSINGVGIGLTTPAVGNFSLLTSSDTALTGTATSATSATGTNTTQIATTAFVQGEKASPAFTGVPTAPTAATGTNTTQIATTAFVQGEKASPAFTGTPTAPTATTGTNTTQIATTAFTQQEITANNKYVLIDSQTASNSPSIDFTSLAGASYSKYVVIVDNVVPVSNGVFLDMQISTGSGFITTAYHHETLRFTSSASGIGGSTSDTKFDITGASESLGTGSNQTASFEIDIFGASSISPLKRATWKYSGLMASATYITATGGGEVDTNSAVIDGISITVSTGNISSGTFKLYGVKN